MSERKPYRRQAPRQPEQLTEDMVRYWLRRAEDQMDQNTWARRFVEAVQFLLRETA